MAYSRDAFSGAVALSGIIIAFCAGTGVERLSLSGVGEDEHPDVASPARSDAGRSNLIRSGECFCFFIFEPQLAPVTEYFALYYPANNYPAYPEWSLREKLPAQAQYPFPS